MILEDRVYGPEEVKEKILIDLINSSEFERLKGVSQLGLPQEYYSKEGFSRYEHSLGVFILLKKLGADLNEQIAGLLHDINHLSFSHVIDWIFGNPLKEDYQDKNYFSFLQNSSIPKILEENGFNLNSFSNLETFYLLEKSSPSLCADRIDYSLRELSVDGKKDLAKKVFENLNVKKKQIVFKDLKYAKIFSEEYSSLQNNSWGSGDSRMRYFLLSEILKKGFEKKFIILEDLKKPEKEILNYLESLEDDFIKFNLKLLREGFDLIEDERGIELKKKFRYIDPEISSNGSYRNLSFFSREYLNFLKKEKNKSENFSKWRAIPKIK